MHLYIPLLHLNWNSLLKTFFLVFGYIHIGLFFQVIYSFWVFNYSIYFPGIMENSSCLVKS